MGWQPLPGAARPPTRVGEVLDRVLDRLGAPDRAGIEAAFDRWDEVVGESLAARTRPVAIDGEALVVACDEPAVATHVRFLEPQLVARLAELAGSRRITRIEVRVTRRQRGPRPPRRAPKTG